MKRKSGAGLLAGAMLGLCTAPASAIGITTSEGWGLSLRGFVNARADYDNRDLGNSEPLFPARSGSAQGDQSTFRFSPNMTQIGFGLKAPPGEIEHSAYIEFDFLDESASPPNRPNTASPRLRHAYWATTWGEGHSLLVGQTNVLFGDRLPDMMFDNLNLALGSLFGREAQVRYTYVSPVSSGSNMVYAVSINAPNSGLFNQGTDTAERTATPFLHAKIAFQTDALGKAAYFEFEDGGDVPAEIALTGFYGRERVGRLAGPGGTEEVDAKGVAVSGVLPVIGIRNGQRAGSLSLMAQAWFVSNGDSYFGGNGQGIYETSTGQVDAIEGKGFFVTGKYFFTEKTNLTLIYSYEKNDLNDLTNAGTPFRIASGLFTDSVFGAPGVAKARTANATLWFHPLKQVYAGLGYDYRYVDYNDGANGNNSRVSGTLFYNF